jgi:Ca2+-binding EF-hand superfamily protein
MQDYQKRVVSELDELNLKRIKLQTFMTMMEFNELQNHQKELLVRQLVIMDLYAETLMQRISGFR